MITVGAALGAETQHKRLFMVGVFALQDKREGSEVETAEKAA